MTETIGSIAEFYGAGAPSYAHLSEDRDFAKQATALVAAAMRGAPGGRFLELFAGPARHSIELERGFSTTCIAVDQSPAMRAVATAAGGLAPERYLISRLPDLPAPSQIGHGFAGASILRYSIGYLSPVAVVTLLTRLAGLMQQGAGLVLELHDLALVRDDFRSLDIRDRIVVGPDGRHVRCLWPAGALRWHADDWVVEMDVLVQTLVGERVVEEHRFVSVERIYARAEVLALAELAGGWRSQPMAADAFPGSTMVLLIRA